MGVVLLPGVAILTIDPVGHSAPDHRACFVSKARTDSVELAGHHAAEAGETDHYSRHDDCGDDGIFQCGDRMAIPNRSQDQCATWQNPAFRHNFLQYQDLIQKEGTPGACGHARSWNALLD